MKLFGTLVAFAAAQDSYGYGDPHFSVQCPGQDRICFDFNPAEGTEMNLVIDPESSLAVTASALTRESGRTYMHSVHFSSPNGAHLEFDMNGVHLAGLGDQKPTDKHPLTGHQQYGDILFVEKYSKDGSHEHTKVQIEEGPTFQIVSNVEKGAFLVSVLDSTGISQKSRGIIGQFVREDAYAIQTDGQTDQEGNKIGQIVAGGMKIDSVQKEWHKEQSCWVVDDKDILFLMANL